MLLAREHHMFGTAEGIKMCCATCTQLQMMQLAHSNTSASTEFTCYLGFKIRLS